jgi:hypothetical protein
MIVIENNIQISGTDRSLIFTDITGVYSVNNTGGYGTPNADRADVALYFYAKRLPYNKPFEVVSLATNYIDYNSEYTNEYKSTFELEYDKDGWYQVFIIALPISYDTPSNGDVRYNTVSEKIEIYNDGWEDFDLDDTETVLLSGDYEYGSHEDIYQLNLIDQKNCATVNYIDCIQCTSCKCDQHFEEASKSKMLIEGIDYIFYSNKKYEAVKILEKANKEFNCCS